MSNRIVFKIEGTGKRCTYYIYSQRRIFDVLLYHELADSYEEAIEASSWCELATVGEVFYGKDFTITVEEE